MIPKQRHQKTKILYGNLIMNEFTTGDIFKANVDALVNTVNCVGVMGKGLALQFKKKYLDNYKLYEVACKNGEVAPGKMFVTHTDTEGNPRYIINFPTKRHWRDDSRMEYIETGIVDLIKTIKEKNIQSIAIPPLGCGLGGLDWNQVKSKIIDAMGDLENVRVVVYEPQDQIKNIDKTDTNAIQR